jgi:serine/threonine-protein kinase
VKLADFGIAKAAEDSRITQIGSVLGTAAYLSPERTRGEEATASADVYSLGVVVYQMLTGKVPYETGSLTELALRQQEGEPDPPSALSPEVGDALDRAIMRALASDPRLRYGRAPEFKEAIEEAERGRDTAVTLALAAAARDATADTEVTRRMAASAPAPVRERAVQTYPPPAAPVPSRERRRGRGAFGRFLALVFLFLLIATTVAAVVIVSSGGSNSHHYEKVVRDTVNDQINGLRDLIDQARK